MSAAAAPDEGWEQRVVDVWAAADDLGEAELRRRVEQLPAELPTGSAVAAFERACAQDSTGHPHRAVPLYRQALATGLTEVRRRRAVIQLASSLRALGNAEASRSNRVAWASTKSSKTLLSSPVPPPRSSPGTTTWGGAEVAATALSSGRSAPPECRGQGRPRP